MLRSPILAKKKDVHARHDAGLTWGGQGASTTLPITLRAAISFSAGATPASG
jgi:hypothetical protein